MNRITYERHTPVGLYALVVVLSLLVAYLSVQVITLRQDRVRMLAMSDRIYTRVVPDAYGHGYNDGLLKRRRRRP